ncbi:MAG: M3 family oligoendopeptidase [Candidatus Heimdallarchaeota archaeon]|nr:MAG: M3 family oligoendopeptidase [Candidatus Heimdallarchaeota archaeon]
MTSKWDLSFLYKGFDDPKIDEDLNQAKEIADDLEKYRGKIKTGDLSSKELLELFQQDEKVQTLVSKAEGYGALLFYQETTNEDHKALYAKMQQQSVDIENKLIWIILELNELDEELLQKYLQDPLLANYHHYIIVKRLSKPYLLSEPVEQVLSQKSLVGRDAWLKFYQEFTAAFEFEVEIKGDLKKMSPGEIYPLFRDPNPEIREKVFKAYYQKYADESIAINHCFNNIWKNHGQDVNLRKYPTIMTPAHIRNQTDEKIVQTMMDIIKKNYSLVQEYYKTKAKLMGQGNKIKGSDLYAPLGKAIKYTWEEAKHMVLEAYTEFDSEIGEMAKQFFDHNLIDSEVRKTKRFGAFCMGIAPGIDPLIQMSFDGTSDGVSTLAHEMGHGLHDVFSGRKQTLFNYNPPLVAAETASVFGEQILIDKLLMTMTDEKAKLKILTSQLEDAIVTISRQTMYVFWENESHEKGAKENLSSKQMSDIWDKHVRDTYGDAVDFLPEQSWNWATIPHFLDPRVFYCYAYSFGMLFVLGLYQKYLEEGNAFIPKYKRILEAGGSQFPVDLAASVGLDITQPDFWQAGFDYLQKLLKEFQAIVEKRT